MRSPRRLQREIDRHETAEQSYMEEGVKISNWRKTPNGGSHSRSHAKAAFAQLPAIELLLGGWRGPRHPSASPLIC